MFPLACIRGGLRELRLRKGAETVGWGATPKNRWTRLTGSERMQLRCSEIQKWMMVLIHGDIIGIRIVYIQLE